jgi:class 3 adenylate cyclase
MTMREIEGRHAMNLEELGGNIRTWRTRLGFTQNDLASSLQVSPQAVSKWERGENAPDIATLPALSEILGVSIDTLLGSNYREKRTVDATVLYADMEGFGPLARSLAPADLAIALNAFFYPLTEHLLAHDGIPIKYVGDEVFAVFSGDSHRLRAFRAAFAARAASPRPLRISIASGLLWMGSLGHPLYARPDILGAPINLAASMQDWMKANAPSGVAASEDAIIPIASSLILGTSGQLKTWARTEPVTIHEVTGLA